ncbi:tRNA (guanosine(46)-N7)-methyltransferase TrmB [Salisediminibacterium halotolerans]|uniref:tRNA (guanine-N(7)-)-methyltransferase n=1 Tax=Salisediminibacterium halotolerans TaxID=517425 RepID=A0A1H9UYA5_9BACI|nr:MULTISPECIES: tRNA (guanosine(46)-N7)-methyltransferase TrmB [Salisediminibacterium]RLJ69406.1 tRNA (guanine-N7-)-methyltransferase [Actinophytocola xinjiangensis]RPE83968.1 tRNA (guanine-N7-)-methyltransferase [Salisediminibacterium halotolerans]TWG32481.1 tRNA (guanine-N7-)-methyltransferase [Salisediminibacterium halotolerans]SES14402.1 tRNA (guanine-N7-)-methyltransferase [Salisediminibacterium haloalkalitolerans]GEL07678.1 tRNA (guanine-N(7)-)-methyltransferase [Salisediminibacterium h
MRLRNKPWARSYMDARPHIVELDPRGQKGRWKELFGNDNPLHIEIGTGKGRFITEMAKANPEINYIGIERFESVIVKAVQKAGEEPPPNLRLIEADVKNIEHLFAQNEVDRLYLNFSDPWPKKRHAKRRLTNEWFLKWYALILKDHGEIHFKTDNQGLFEYSIESMTAFGYRLKNISLDLHNSEMTDNIMTEYEEKFSNKGMRIYRLEATLNW